MGDSTIIPDKQWTRARSIFRNMFEVLPDYSSG